MARVGFLLDLPPELLGEVCSYISQDRDVCSLLEVSRQLRSFSWRYTTLMVSNFHPLRTWLEKFHKIEHCYFLNRYQRACYRVMVCDHHLLPLHYNPTIFAKLGLDIINPIHLWVNQGLVERFLKWLDKPVLTPKDTLFTVSCSSYRELMGWKEIAEIFGFPIGTIFIDKLKPFCACHLRIAEYYFGIEEPVCPARCGYESSCLIYYAKLKVRKLVIVDPDFPSPDVDSGSPFREHVLALVGKEQKWT